MKIKLYLIAITSLLVLVVKAQTNCFAPFADFRYSYGNVIGNAIAQADMNNDNKRDVIIAAGDIIIMNGNANGTFGVGSVYTTNGQTSGQLQIADFNNDNKPDIISFDNPSSGTKSLSIYINVNYTSISQVLVVPTNINGGGFYNPGNIEVADLDGDGKNDVVVNDYDGNKLYVYKNNGNNTLSLIDSMDTPVKPMNIALGDLNGDNRADIVCNYEYSTDSVSVFINGGTGNFGAGVNIAGGFSYGGIALGDFDGDTKLDLISSTSPYFRYRKGNGNGTFATAYTDVYLAATGKKFITGDWNNDTKLDVAFQNGNGHSGGVVFGNGDGTFQPLVGFSSYGDFRDMVIADFDGDNNEDMIILNAFERNISFLKGQADGTFGPLSLRAGAGAERFTMGLINGDTIPDIITADYRAMSVSVMLSNGDGSFQASIHDTCGGSPHDVALGHFNNDGMLDAAVANNGNISVLLGNGNGTFQTPMVGVINGPGGDWAAATGLVNSDNFVDLVASVANKDSIYIALGNGNGTFQSAIAYEAGNRPYDVKLALINNDNFLDAVVPNDLSNDVSVLFGTGTGAFQAPLSLGVGAGPRAVVAVDLDNDSDIDIASVNNNGDNISVLINNGNGSFATQATYPVTSSSSPSTISAGKFNGDNFIDLIVSQPSASTVAILLNNGNGTFGSLSTYGTDYSPNDALLHDFNYDGFTDIASCNEVGSVTVVLNSGVTLSAAGSTQLCDGDSVQLIATGGTSYLWSTGATTSSIYASASGIYTVTVTVNTQAGNCLAEPTNIPVAVSSGPPTVSMTAQNRYCISDGTLNLAMVGGSPQGGSYSGNNVSNGIFDIAGAGTGAHIVTYSISNSCGTNSISDTIFVDTETLASINFPSDTFCDSQGPVILAPYGSPAGGVWGVNNTVVTVVNPSNAGVGTYLLHYTIVAGGCRDTAYVLAVVEHCTGIDEIAGTQVNIYPNPGNGNFVVQIENDQKFERAEIFDACGRRVVARNVNGEQHVVFYTGLATGFYTLRLQSLKGTLSKKIIIE